MRDVVKMGVLVSGGGTNLASLLKAERAGTLRAGKVSLVISSDKSAFAVVRAKRWGIPCVVIERGGFPSASLFNAAILRELEERGIELCVLAGFLPRVTGPLLGAFKGRIINIHPSLLPAFGGKGYYGLKVHEAVLKAGAKRTGATVHFVEEGIDSGKVILQREVVVKKGDTPRILQKRVMKKAERIVLPAAVQSVCAELLSAKRVAEGLPLPFVGITGLYAAGKNRAARILEDKGFTVVDVDKLGHGAIAARKAQIIARFGSGILRSDGEVDRKALGAIVFGDSEKLRALEDIIHPEVNAMLESVARSSAGRPLAIHAALLHKCALYDRLDAVIIVRSPFITRLIRAKKRDNLPLRDILARFASQKDIKASIAMLKKLKKLKKEKKPYFLGKNADNNIVEVFNAGDSLAKTIECIKF